MLTGKVNRGKGTENGRAALYSLGIGGRQVLSEELISERRSECSTRVNCIITCENVPGRRTARERPQGGHVLSKYFPGTARKPELLQPNYLKEEKEEVRLERGWSQTWRMCESIL